MRYRIQNSKAKPKKIKGRDFYWPAGTGRTKARLARVGRDLKAQQAAAPGASGACHEQPGAEARRRAAITRGVATLAVAAAAAASNQTHLSISPSLSLSLSSPVSRARQPSDASPPPRSSRTPQPESEGGWRGKTHLPARPDSGKVSIHLDVDRLLSFPKLVKRAPGEINSRSLYCSVASV